jgi:ArsR family transcriptional regulator
LEVLSDYYLQKIALVFSLLGDTGRIKIISALFDGELCVNHICEKTDYSQPAVSHQLRLLKQNDIVKSRRVGKNIFYSLVDEHVRKLFEISIEHVLHTYSTDEDIEI